VADRAAKGQNDTMFNQKDQNGSKNAHPFPVSIQPLNNHKTTKNEKRINGDEPA